MDDTPSQPKPPRRRLTDDEVEHMRELHDTGVVGYTALAKFFKVSKNTVASILQYRWRTPFIAENK